MLTESHVWSVFQTRLLAVIGREWAVTPASDRRADKKAAEFVTNCLLNIDFDSARQAILPGLFYGFKVAEILWDYDGSNVVIKDIIGRACRRFVFDVQGRLRLLTPENMFDGELLPDRKFVLFRNPSTDGSYYGSSLASNGCWLTIL